MPGPEVEAASKHSQMVDLFDKKLLDENTGSVARYLVKFFVDQCNFEQARKYICLMDALVEKVKDQEEASKLRVFIFCKLDYYVGLLKWSADKLQAKMKMSFFSISVFLIVHQARTWVQFVIPLDLIMPGFTFSFFTSGEKTGHDHEEEN